MYLIFDTETTGLPEDYNAPASDLDNWPRIVQIAWEIYSEDRQLVQSKNLIIKPEGFIVPTVASDIHGITTEVAVKYGLGLEACMLEFLEALKMCEEIIAHNINFDMKVVAAEFIRAKTPKLGKNLKKVDTMKESTNFCKIKNNWGGYKWPQLTELHEKLFECGFDGAHDALIDVKACGKCFFELKDLKII